MRVQILKEMVAYQDASVVSKEIIKKDSGNITLFAFDRGQGLSEHISPFDALVYILDGQALISISGTASTVNAGEMVVMPAGRPHSLRAPQRFKMLLVLVKS